MAKPSVDQRPSFSYPEPVEGTFLIDVGHETRNGLFALASFEKDVTVQVDWDGEVYYAHRRDDEGANVWWFAGTGEVR